MRRHIWHRAVGRIERRGQVPRHHGAGLSSRIGFRLFGGRQNRGCQPRWRRGAHESPRVERLLQREAAVRVAEAALVARVQRVDANDDFESLACTHGTVRKLIILAQRDIGEALLAGECGAVREAAEKNAEAVARRERSEAGHQHHVSQLQRRDVGVTSQDGRDLRAHSSWLVEGVVIPVEDHLARRYSSRLHAFLADGGATWQDEQPHAQALCRRIGRRARMLEVGLRASRRKHD